MKSGGIVTTDGCSGLEQLVAAGFIPVLHGDSVIDTETGCCILSSDTILEVLSLSLIHTCENYYKHKTRLQ